MSTLLHVFFRALVGLTDKAAATSSRINGYSGSILSLFLNLLRLFSLRTTFVNCDNGPTRVAGVAPKAAEDG